MSRRTALAFLHLVGVALLVAGCSWTNLENFPDTASVVERADFIDRRPLPGLSDYRGAAQLRAKELLKQPLSLSAAMEIAMLNTPSLQVRYLQYQVWDEDLVAALADAAKSETDPTSTSIEWKAAQLALMKSVNAVRQYDFADEYIAVAEEFIEVGEEVGKAYFEATAAQQLESLMQQIATATQAAAELGNQQYLAGTASRRAQVAQQMTHAESVKALADAKLALVAARERLNRLLGLWGEDVEWQAPERLPDLPDDRPVYSDLEEYALLNRFDALADRKTWSLWQTAVEVRSEIRENYAALQAAYDLAKYQKETVVPLSQTMLEETQKEYSGMLMGVYDLIDATREQIEAGREYVETLRDFWIARAELAQSVGGKLP